MGFKQVASQCGTNKNIDYYGDGWKGWTKPTKARVAKKIARRSVRRHQIKLISQYLSEIVQ